MPEVDAEMKHTERALRMVIAKKMLGIDNQESLVFTSNEVDCKTLTPKQSEITMDPHYVGVDMFGRNDPLGNNGHNDTADLEFKCTEKEEQKMNVDLSVRSVADQIDVIFRPAVGKPISRKYCIDWRIG